MKKLWFCCLVLFFSIIASVAAENMTIINIPANSQEGVNFTAPSDGYYQISIDRGAGSQWTLGSPYFPGWVCKLYVFFNRPIKWTSGPHGYGPYTSDYILGNDTFYPTAEEAARATYGQKITLNMKKGDYLHFIYPDVQGSFDNNPGIISVKILNEVNQQPVATSKATPSSTTSAPITISTTGQTPTTYSGDSSYYFTVIIVLIIILCVGGVYSLHLIRKKNSVNIAYPEEKHLSGSTSSNTTADNATKFRPSSFENGSTHHDIFISYSSEDKPIADAICNHLESRQIRCWVAPRDILPGINYQESIIDAIDSSSIMVLVFSSHSNKSPHVLTELNEAMSNGTIIIPFRIENILPSKAMKYLISTPHWLDAMTPPLEYHIQELEETLRILIEKERRKQKSQ
jgi:hypothetical protein